jgi:UDP-glucose:(heptosyl)LPS alpha-1,3-glucosyltransferase
MAACGVPENKIAVLYNGVDLERFHPANRSRWREKIKKQWGIPMDAPLVLFVGSGFRRKGLDRLLKIWDTPRLHGVYFLVVGADAQLARYRSWSEKQAKGRVIFAGVQKNIESYYGAADLLALLSFQDPFGNVALEALASGLPALVSKEVGAAEVLTGELEQGILADADDPQELTQRIVQMLDGARWSSLSRVARETAERHSWKRYFQELEQHLLTVAEPAP